MTGPLRITPEEVQAARVDEILSQQESFGLPVPQREGGAQPLWFRPWFALMIAGLLGGFLAWALLEPFYDDGLRIRARVEALTPLHEAPGTLQDLAVEAGGVRILVPTEARVELERGRRGTVHDLQPGDSLEVLLQGWTPERGQGGAAHIRRLSTPVPAGPVDMEPLVLRQQILNLIFFPLVTAFVGLMVGAADGLLSRALRRALLAGGVSLGLGLLGGLILHIPANMVFGLGVKLAESLAGDRGFSQDPGAFLVHVMARATAWSLLGLAAGMGQGIAMRSRRLLVNGLVGGAVGALLGGLLFDPVALLGHRILGSGGAEASRAIGFSLVGAGVGLMVGLVELMAREAWVRILTGPIAGKEFVLYRDPTWVGSSPKSDLYLFKDPQVAPRHAAFHRMGEHFELEDSGTPSGTVVDGRPIKRARLRDGSRILIGRTTMEFRIRDE